MTGVQEAVARVVAHCAKALDDLVVGGLNLTFGVDVQAVIPD